MLLNSFKTASMDGESGENRPQAKKLCSAESADEVIGPVDKGDRRIAKKGARRSVRSACRISINVKICERRKW